MRIFKIIIFIVFVSILSSCKSEDKKQPFGAINIEYEKVEEYNKEGPELIENHEENTPPTANKNQFIVENGPKIDEERELVEPTADMDKEPDYGGIPVIPKRKD